MKLNNKDNLFYLAQSPDTNETTLAAIFLSLHNKIKQTEFKANENTIPQFTKIKQIAEQTFSKIPEKDDWIVLFTMIIYKIKANNINGLIETMTTADFWQEIKTIIGDK